MYMMITQAAAYTCICTEPLISKRIFNKKKKSQKKVCRVSILKSTNRELFVVRLYLFTIVEKFEITQVYQPARIKRSINVT